MGKIYLTSDLHLCHDREFVWKDRGFESIEEHNQVIIDYWNSTITEEDTVYVLGDVMLHSESDETPFQHGLEILKKLKGNIIIVRGNHDSEERVKLYEECENVQSANNAALYLKYPEIGGYTFFLSHYPTITSHEKLKKMKSAIINLHGHTHQKEHFFNLNGVEHPYMYCCCMDAHECTPVLLDDIIEEIKLKRSAWKEEQ